MVDHTQLLPLAYPGAGRISAGFVAFDSTHFSIHDTKTRHCPPSPLLQLKDDNPNLREISRLVCFAANVESSPTTTPPGSPPSSTQSGEPWKSESTPHLLRLKAAERQLDPIQPLSELLPVFVPHSDYLTFPPLAKSQARRRLQMCPLEGNTI